MPAFFDTNVALYLLSSDERKAQIAEDLIAAGGTVSVQVLNEFVAVARRKCDLPWDRVQAVLEVLATVCSVQPLSVAAQRQAVAWSREHGFSIYDANILASAAEAGCDRLYSEDLQHGRRLGPLQVLNPFV